MKKSFCLIMMSMLLISGCSQTAESNSMTEPVSQQAEQEMDIIEVKTLQQQEQQSSIITDDEITVNPEEIMEKLKVKYPNAEEDEDIRIMIYDYISCNKNSEEEYIRILSEKIGKYMECQEFVKQFQAEYPNDIYDTNLSVLREVFYDYYGQNLTYEQYKEIFESRNIITVYPFKEKTIIGLVNEHSSKLTLQKVKEIVSEYDNFHDILNEFGKIQPYADEVGGSGTTFAVYEPSNYEKIYVNYTYKSIFYTKVDDNGEMIRSYPLYPYPKLSSVSSNENTPDVVISQPKKIGDTYQITVTSEQKQPFVLGLEETVTATGKLYRKTVLIENGKGTFETDSLAAYKPVFYYSDRKEVSKNDIKNLVKGYSYKTEGNNYYCNVSFSFEFDRTGMMIYDIESSKGEVAAHYKMIQGGERFGAAYSLKLNTPKENVTVNIIPRYVFTGCPKYFDE